MKLRDVLISASIWAVFMYVGNKYIFPTQEVVKYLDVPRSDSEFLNSPQRFALSACNAARLREPKELPSAHLSFSTGNKEIKAFCTPKLDGKTFEYTPLCECDETISTTEKLTK